MYLEVRCPNRHQERVSCLRPTTQRTVAHWWKVNALDLMGSDLPRPRQKAEPDFDSKFSSARNPLVRQY